jgi:hypothetical protein
MEGCGQGSTEAGKIRDILGAWFPTSECLIDCSSVAMALGMVMSIWVTRHGSQLGGLARGEFTNSSI